MADLFISYSRRNTDFVRRLYDGLIENDINAWVDWEGIPPTADWLAEIYTAIESANTFIFVISPDSVSSEVCGLELAHAVKNNKRLIPLLHIESRNVPKVLAAINWIYFREEDDFQDSIAKLLESIRTDLDWVKMHTRLLIKAIEWDNKNRDESFVLRGSDLDEAEAWLRESTDKEPAPTPLHTQYIIASRDAAANRQKKVLVAVSFFSVLMIVLTVLAFQQWREAVAQRNVANEQRMLAERNRLRAEQKQAEAERERRRADRQRQIAEQNREIAEQNQEIAEQKRIEAERERQRAEKQRRIAEFEKQKADSLKILAEASEAEAIEQRKNADRLRLLSVARTMAIQATKLQKQEKAEINALLALQSYKYNRQHGGSLLDPDIYNALRSSLSILADESDGILRRHDDAIRATQFTHSGDRLVSSGDDGSVVVWDVETGRPLQTHRRIMPTRIRSCAISHDDKKLALGGFNGQVSLMDLEATNPNPITFIAHDRVISELVFSLNNTRLITASYDGLVKMWDLTTAIPQLLHSFEGGDRMRCVALSPNGDLLAIGGNDGKIYLEQVDHFGQARLILDGGLTNINAITFSPDGKLLASAHSDRSVRIWSVGEVDNQEPLTFIGHLSSVTDVEFDQSGELLASSSLDKTVRIWNVNKPDEEPIVLEGHDDWIWTVAYSPQGNMVASGSADRTVRLWITQPSILAERICEYVTRNMTDKEWEKYVGEDIPYERTCSNLPENITPEEN